MTTMTAPETRAVDEVSTANTIWGLTRIALGLTFLWAFLDKLLALGFSTGRIEDGSIDFLGEAAWVSGGSPTYGFLNFGTTGPFAEFYQSVAGAAWADWLFMIGLLGIGVALTLGIGMKLGAYAGAALLLLMWTAALPPENHPFLDDHVIYGLVLLGLAKVNAGDWLGFGQRWRASPLVERYPILR